MKSIERLKLGKQPETDKGLTIGFLSSLPKLLSVDCGGHGVADPRSLLKFRPETAIKLTNLYYLSK